MPPVLLVSGDNLLCLIFRPGFDPPSAKEFFLDVSTGEGVVAPSVGPTSWRVVRDVPLRLSGRTGHVPRPRRGSPVRLCRRARPARSVPPPAQPPVQAEEVGAVRSLPPLHPYGGHHLFA